MPGVEMSHLVETGSRSRSQLRVMSSDLAVCHPSCLWLHRAKRYTKNSRRAYPSRVKRARTCARTRGNLCRAFFDRSKSWARKSNGKSRNEFAGHVRRIETIKTLPLSLSLPVSLSLSRSRPEGIHKSILAIQRAGLCLGAKTWFNSAHNCSAGIAESPRIRINAHQSAALLFRFDNSSRIFSLAGDDFTITHALIIDYTRSPGDHTFASNMDLRWKRKRSSRSLSLFLPRNYRYREEKLVSSSEMCIDIPDSRLSRLYERSPRSLFSYKSVVSMLLGSSVCTSAARAHIFPKRHSWDKESTKDSTEETASLSRAIILIFCYHIHNIVTRPSISPA